MTSYMATGQTSSSPVYISPIQTWHNWNTASTAVTSGSIITNTIWSNWQSASTNGFIITPNKQITLAAPKKAKSKVNAERAQLARTRQRAQHKREKPDRKAETLLLKHLNKEQRISWINQNYFEFNVGTRRYRIKRGKVGNVALLGADGKAMVLYCCHPANDVPVPLADVAMSQWMMLKYNEDGFLKLANIHYRRPIQQAA